MFQYFDYGNNLLGNESVVSVIDKTERHGTVFKVEYGYRLTLLSELGEEARYFLEVGAIDGVSQVVSHCIVFLSWVSMINRKPTLRHTSIMAHSGMGCKSKQYEVHHIRFQGQCKPSYIL